MSRPGPVDRWPVHPVLVAAFPVLWLWAANAGEVEPADVWPWLWQAVAGAAAVWVAAAVTLRDWRRGALLASLTAALLLSYGHVWGSASPWLGLPVWTVVLVAGAVGVRRLAGSGLGVATRAVNVAAVALVVTTVPALVGEASAGGPSGADEASVTPTGATAPTRDVWYVILDRYGREDSLREVFGFDDGDWTTFLERHGFDVLDRALANYPKTAHSLGASLNLTYLDRLGLGPGVAAGDDWGPVYDLLREHRMGEVLTAAGYHYVHVGSWWSPTATAASADEVLTYDRDHEFAQVLRLTTALPALQAAAGTDAPVDLRRLKADHALHQFRVLERLAAERAATPRFVFAHIALPHEPYVFEADGAFVSAEQEAARDRTANFVPQVRYTSARMRRIVDILLADRAPGEEPIVVIQADEGPHPQAYVAEGGRTYSWLDAPVAELREKLRILAAVHLPGVDDDDLPEDLTPVNLTRLAVGAALGTDLPLLPDRAYVFPDETDLYDFHDVTARVRGS